MVQRSITEACVVNLLMKGWLLANVFVQRANNRGESFVRRLQGHEGSLSLVHVHCCVCMHMWYASLWQHRWWDAGFLYRAVASNLSSQATRNKTKTHIDIDMNMSWHGRFTQPHLPSLCSLFKSTNRLLTEAYSYVSTALKSDSSLRVMFISRGQWWSWLLSGWIARYSV